MNYSRLQTTLYARKSGRNDCITDCPLIIPSVLSFVLFHPNRAPSDKPSLTILFPTAGFMLITLRGFRCSCRDFGARCSMCVSAALQCGLSGFGSSPPSSPSPLVPHWKWMDLRLGSPLLGGPRILSYRPILQSHRVRFRQDKSFRRARIQGERNFFLRAEVAQDTCLGISESNYWLLRHGCNRLFNLYRFCPLMASTCSDFL